MCKDYLKWIWIYRTINEIEIKCDSLKDGLGSYLILKGQPISFVSCSF